MDPELGVSALGTPFGGAVKQRIEAHHDFDTTRVGGVRVVDDVVLGLITSSGNRYVITQRAGSYKVIQNSKVKAVTVEKRDRPREQSIFQLLT
jgi:hypothetical protein